MQDQDLVIDWELAITLAGNSREFAKKMFLLLVKDLPNELAGVKKEYAADNIKALKNRLHRLHGALCYCGATRLKNATATLRQALENKEYSQIPALLTQFELEVNELIKQVTCSTF